MSHNTWVHRTVRPLVRLLARTSISPNQVTTARLCFGLAGAAVAAIGPTPWLAIGAGLFLVSFLLDRTDGALARMTKRSSASGHRYDALSDVACNGTIFLGIGIALRDGPLGWWMPALGAFVGLAMVTGLLIDLRLKAAGSDAAEIEVAGFDLDDAMLIPLLAMWTGWTSPLLYAAAIGAPVFALFLLWQLRQLRTP
jgi:archaetidylinositol phosphate synthase